MAKPSKPDPAPETTPKQFPEVVPTAYSDGWVVEAMMQMQHTIGEMKATVNHLKEASDAHGAKIDRMSHVIFAAGVVLAIILAIGGFFLSKIWDGIFALMLKMPNVPPTPPGP